MVFGHYSFWFTLFNTKYLIPRWIPPLLNCNSKVKSSEDKLTMSFLKQVRLNWDSQAEKSQCPFDVKHLYSCKDGKLFYEFKFWWRKKIKFKSKKEAFNWDRKVKREIKSSAIYHKNTAVNKTLLKACSDECVMCLRKT